MVVAPSAVPTATVEPLSCAANEVRGWSDTCRCVESMAAFYRQLACATVEPLFMGSTANRLRGWAETCQGNLEKECLAPCGVL
eukprot:scaffold82975_cov19-Tisochrysis_lutea.AAC.1